MVLNQLHWILIATFNVSPLCPVSRKISLNEFKGKHRISTIKLEMNNYSKPIYHRPLGAEAQVIATNDRLPKANIIYIRRPPVQTQIDSTNFTRYTFLSNKRRQFTDRLFLKSQLSFSVKLGTNKILIIGYQL